MSDTASVVLLSLPTAEGLQLWRVVASGSYYDDDPRMPGTTAVEYDEYVLARTKDEAVTAARTAIAKAKKESDIKPRVMATVVNLEDLVPAREGEESWDEPALVKLSGAQARKYRLAVCLVEK